MQKAVRVVYDLSEDTRIREEARMREKRLHDEASIINDAIRQGLKQGRAEGEQIGLTKGKAEAEKKLSSLVTLLLELGRHDDLARIQDKEALKALYEEFGL